MPSEDAPADDEALNAAKQATEARVRTLRQRLVEEERVLDALRRECYRRLKRRAPAPASPESDLGESLPDE